MEILNWSYSYVFQNYQPRSQIQNLLQLENEQYDVAFFGSSRTRHHIDCDLIYKMTGQTCMNFGISAGTIGDMLILMTILESRNVTYKKAFMQVDYNYNSSGLSNTFKANLGPYLREKGVRHQLSNLREDFSFKHIPFYSYIDYYQVIGLRELGGSIFFKKPKRVLDIGFYPNYGTGLALSGEFPVSFKSKNTELDKMQEMQDIMGNSLIFFTAPYCINVGNRKVVNEFKKKIPALRNYISLFDGNEKYFSDCGHLNLEGATEFTRIITNDLLMN